MRKQTNVLVIGAGPAGIATAIAASQRGLRVTVLDARVPPIDKACGEGVLPHGVAALRDLGIHLNSDVALPFSGIRFIDENSSACSEFPKSPGFALRRVKLHELLMGRATRAGVEFRWGARVEDIHSDHVTIDKQQLSYDWLVGADGQNSIVRKWAGLHSQHTTAKRFGFRRHFRIRPWSNFVEVYWGNNSQMFVTPTAPDEVGVAVFSCDPQLRIVQALQRFPALGEQLRSAIPTTKELGDVTSLTRLPVVTQKRVALIGDASGTVDALTGHGLSLSFQQALSLGESLHSGDLKPYENAHRNISSMPAMMTRVMLLMDRNNWIRRRTLYLFQREPDLFSKLLSIHTGALPVSSIGVSEMANFGWNFLRA